jgi:hypothetical protein
VSADVVTHDTLADVDDLAPLFTAARLARIAEAEADINSGKSFTTQQADAELAKRREEWIGTHPR